MIQNISLETTKAYFNPERTALLTEVFKKTLIECAVTAVVFSVTAVFILSGSGVVLLAASAGSMLLINASVRLGIAELIYRNNHNPTNDKKVLIEALSSIAPMGFSVITANSSDIVIHELGHAAAAKALFANSSPSIVVNPFKGGYTSYYISGLTELGKKIGFRSSDLAVTAAGAGLALTFSAVLLTGSYAVETSHPELSKYLYFSSILNIANHAFYALSALWTPLTESGHDFVHLSLHGISPILSAAGIIAIPVVIKLAFVGGYYLKQMASQPVNAVAA